MQCVVLIYSNVRVQIYGYIINSRLTIYLNKHAPELQMPFFSNTPMKRVESFWVYTVQGRSVGKKVEKLGISIGGVYQIWSKHYFTKANFMVSK